MTQLYYTAPEESVFEEVKQKAIELWQERYPEETSPFYASEKVGRIKNLENIQDNLMYIVAMFDDENQSLLAEKLSDKAREQIRHRMIDGGTPMYYITF